MGTPSRIIKIVSAGPQGRPGASGSIGPRGFQGPSGSADGSFTRDANDNLFYEDGDVGIGPTFDLIDPSAKLEIRQPVREGQFGDGNDLFLIKLSTSVIRHIKKVMYKSISIINFQLI